MNNLRMQASSASLSSTDLPPLARSTSGLSHLRKLMDMYTYRSYHALHTLISLTAGCVPIESTCSADESIISMHILGLFLPQAL